MVGRDQEAAPKPDGLIQSSTTSTLLASTPSMPPRWSMTDPSGRPSFADCQRSNPSMALNSSQVSRMIGQMSLIALTGNPTYFSLHSMIDRLTLSNAFLKSTNMTYNGVLGVAKASDTY